jgi:hypothetical protein
MPESRSTADFREAMEIQMIYAALANEALGSYLADPQRLEAIRDTFKLAYESLQALWPEPTTMCDINEVHIGCQCWPVTKKKTPTA